MIKEIAMFGHEKFTAYQKSIEFLKLSEDMMKELPRGTYALKDQMKRASISVVLNIAEGSGKIERAERCRFYSIARGSASECAAVCGVIKVVEPRLRTAAEKGKDLLNEIVCILTSVVSKKEGVEGRVRGERRD